MEQELSSNQMELTNEPYKAQDTKHKTTQLEVATQTNAKKELFEPYKTQNQAQIRVYQVPKMKPWLLIPIVEYQ